MLHEIRSYTLVPGKVQEYLRLAEEVSLPIRKSDAGVLVGWWYSEIGELNKLVHIWEWQDLEERQRQRVVLRSRPGWVDVYNPQVDKLVYRREVASIKPEMAVKPPVQTGNLYELRSYRAHRASWGLGWRRSRTASAGKSIKDRRTWQSAIGERTSNAPLATGSQERAEGEPSAPGSECSLLAKSRRCCSICNRPSCTANFSPLQ